MIPSNPISSPPAETLEAQSIFGRSAIEVLLSAVLMALAHDRPAPPSTHRSSRESVGANPVPGLRDDNSNDHQDAVHPEFPATSLSWAAEFGDG